ncbi:TetR/AcrR family transcriptional regulator [Bradyrhizobium prioriisuperbiae]|uniref:TetR/AcrR family transcriptional regulator n=1 Tax=Bradyrhizobium prioriisuperbiae TaxID=2854389 RepID=UPI0028F08B16|nr:TetR/AcrR family transcriptional regulator [Bradyrhizobium prioritasuperba]
MARWKNSLRTSEEISGLKREAVVRESGRIFSRRGYHNASLDDVAKALNVSKGTLYNYTKDKEEILFQCCTMALDIGEKAFEAAKSGMNGAEKLRITLRNYIAMLHDELGACGVITEIDAMTPAHRKIIVARRDDHQQRFIAMMEEGAADGSLRVLDVKLAVYTFMGAINAIPRWYSPQGRLTNQQIADGMVDLLLNGLYPPPSSSGGASRRPRKVR